MNKNSEMVTKNRLDGDELREMFLFITNLFEHNAKSINELNVFPVPDGDTGTNMLMTLRDASKESLSSRSSSVGEIAGLIYKGAFQGARGNSGVILAEILKGIAKGFEGKSDAGVAELANSLRLSRNYAYRAVGEPKEGTILTVIDRVARTAEKCASSGEDMRNTTEAISRTARETVALTPSMLPILREAGVVDAGGHGLAVIFEGIRLYTSGDELAVIEINPPEIENALFGGSGEIALSFLEATEHELYGYCTQFIITGDGLDIDDVRDALSEIANSTVVVGSESMVKVHLHAEDPGPAISLAVSLGTLSQVKVENMDEQHLEFVDSRRGEGAKFSSTSDTGEISVIAVVSGDGLGSIFLEELGAASILSGGDSMNPSVKEILEIVDRAPAQDVILMPNNKNIIMAANLAVEQTSKRLRIVNSKTIPQGIAAMLEFNPEQSLDENTARMEDALSNVKTGEVVRAVREVTLNGVSVEVGQNIGLLDGELLVAGDSHDEVLLSLLQRAEVSEDDLVTIYWGGEISEEQAKSAHGKVTEAFPDTEIELVLGGQPYYHYVVSIE